MVQIEQLGKMLAQLVTNRNDHVPERNSELIGSIFRSLKTDPAFLMEAAPEQIRKALDHEDGEGLARMEIAAKTLLETACLQPEESPMLQAKAKELLLYVQTHDTTFSLERADLLAGI